MNRNLHLAARLLLLIVVSGLVPVSARAADALTLAGEWRFALDRADEGVKQEWFSRDLKDRIKLPGALQSQGYGNEISTATPWVLSLYDRLWHERADYRAYTQPGKVKVPFLSQPPLHYLGAAWYQRDIDIPQEWQNRRIVLHLERPHWESTVWIDDRRVGSNNSLVAPHIYELGRLAAGKHRLTVRVDNRLLMPYRPDAHSVSDSLAGSWNGIVGKMELTATSPVWIDDAQVFPNVEKKSARIKVRIGNLTGEAGKGALIAYGEFSPAQPVTVPVTWNDREGAAEFEVQFDPKVSAWDEFHPAMLKVRLRLRYVEAGSAVRDDERVLDFGLRELRTQGNRFILNGRPIIFRGTHHGGDFPLTGYPPTDVEYWKKLIRICQSWGLNHIRFHSFCPPEAAFVAADELGFYLQPEPGMWNEISPGTAMERMLYEETERMIKAYGNHPSFMLLSPSNEPKGRWPQVMPKWAARFRQEDPRRLYTNGTGHTEREVPNLAEGMDYLVMQRIGPKQLRGVSAWFGRDYRDSLTGTNIPVISHETGQWVAYPDYDIIGKFTGYMRPGNYEIFRDSMQAHSLLERNKDFALASGRYQLECYKEEIEANMRTPGLEGFQLLDLHDYLGQGTALVGLLDAFWETKGYATAAEFRRFCNETVPLARLEKRVYTTGERLDVEVEAAHYGARPLRAARPYWKVVDGGGRTVAAGQWQARPIPFGKNHALGRVSVDLSKLAAPRAYKLVVGLRGTEFENDWDFWLYTAAAGGSAAPSDVLVTRIWEEAEARLAAGGRVLYVPRGRELDWTSPPLDTVPVFWNRLMGPAWGRMLGLWADAKHPALAKFPTEAHFDWQWAEIIPNVRAVNMDRLPRTLQPIVQAIDDWNRNYKLGLLFECRVGDGQLMVSSFNLDGTADSGPVAGQLRRSLLDYMTSARFRPQVSVTPAQIRSLFFDTRIMHRLGAVTKAGALDQNPASNAVDGDPNTFWMVGDPKKDLKHPHELTVSFDKPVEMSGLVLMPRQNHREHEGDIRRYMLEVSDDGKQWREVKRGELASTFEPQQVKFDQEITARHLKLTALSGFGADKTAALAELAVVYTGPKLPDTGEDQVEYQRSKTATPDIDEGTNTAPRPRPTPARRPRRRRP
jgi:beta-galactosidase